MTTAFIIGCGFLGEAAADLLFQEGWKIQGGCATPDAAQRLLHKPYSVQVCNVLETASLRNFSQTRPDLILFCASSRGGGEEEYRNLYLGGVRNLVEVWKPERLLFTSSTSVYAQTQGEIVDENSPAQPDRPTSKILLEAEQEVLSSGGTIARLAGIYGPGRSVLMRKFLAGEAVLEDGGKRWINQIHRDDAARALLHLTHAPAGVYNVCDDRPATQYDVYQWLAEFFKRPLPPKGPIHFQRKRAWTSKRVSNRKLRNLQWSPQWRSYQDALATLVGTAE